MNIRFYALALSLTLSACSAPSENATSMSVDAQAPRPPLSEPAVDHEFFLRRLYHLDNMSGLAPITDVVIEGFGGPHMTPRDGPHLTTRDIEQFLVTGTPIEPGDKLIDSWSYSPWGHATFAADGRKWSVTLYLGGLGTITDDGGHTGAFLFGRSQPDSSTPLEGFKNPHSES